MREGVDKTSSDYNAMSDYWTMANTILGGAKSMRAAGEKFLPKYPYEAADGYELRQKNAKFTNIFGDIVSTLASKPFSQELTLAEDADSSIAALSEDIDGSGNHVHVFAADLFYHGITNAIEWVLVEYPKADGIRTRAQETASGIRPYWVRIPAMRLICVRSAMVGGEEIIVHARIKESATVSDGFGEKNVERIRLFEREPIVVDEKIAGYKPATYTVYEKQEASVAGQKVEWIEVETGPITIGVIPLVPFITGRRIERTWQFVPPLQDAAYLQIEHYQQESGLKYAKELTAFPMLTANGVFPPTDENGKPVPVPVGPKSVLYAPPGQDGAIGSWQFIEPAATSLEFLAKDIDATAKELRELGRQPLTANSGNLTVITTAFAAQKGNSAVQAWALSLKDALENCLKLTALWLGQKDGPSVKIHTDFAVEMHDSQSFDGIMAMYQGNVISADAVIDEAKRRNMLSDSFDKDADKQTILDGFGSLEGP